MMGNRGNGMHGWRMMGGVVTLGSRMPLLETPGNEGSKAMMEDYLKSSRNPNLKMERSRTKGCI